MAKKKPTAKKPAKQTKKKSPTKAAKAPRRIVAVVDPAAELVALGFFRAEYRWELERHIPALNARLRLQVDHTKGAVTEKQVRAVKLLLEAETSLRPLAVRAAFECMSRWVEAYRKRHPDFRGKPIPERAFNRGCDFGTVSFPALELVAPVFVLNIFWPDDNRPCEARFEWIKGAWTVTTCERN